MWPAVSPARSRRPQVSPAPLAPGADQALALLRACWWLAAGALVCERGHLFVLPAPAQTIVWWIVLAGLYVLLAELVVAAVTLGCARARWRGQPASYMRMRAPDPARSIRAERQGASAIDLWHSLYGLLPAAGQCGTPQPYLALLISARPDQPVEFGAAIGGARPAAGGELAALREIIAGYLPDALTDCPPDPLIQALDTMERPVIRSAVLAPVRGLQLPLRRLDEADGELLGPLVARLRPPAGQVQYAEYAVALQPADPHSAVLALWHARAMRFIQRQGAAASTDVSAGRLARKLAEPLFFVTLRVTLVAETRAAGMHMLRDIGASLGQYATGGWPAQRLTLRSVQVAGPGASRRALAHLRPAILRSPRCIWPLPALLLPAALGRPPAVLGAGELAGLWHAPGQALAGLVRWLPCRHLPAPAQAFIADLCSSQASAPERLTLGHALRSDGSWRPVGPTLRDLRQVLHVTAGMGGGKSRLLANLAQQMLPHGLFLIDGKGDDAGNLTRTVAQLVPIQDERRLVLLDITDHDWPISLNPLSALDRSRPGALDQAIASLESIFARLDPETWHQAPGMQQFLGHAARLVIETEPQPTLAHVQRALADQRYRAMLLERGPSDDVALFWGETFPRMPDSQRSSQLALLRRFEKLLASDLLRNIVTQQRAAIDLDRLFDERLIVLCPIPHVTYGALASTAAMLILMLFLRAAFQRPGTAQTRADYPLIVDELQVLVEHGATQDMALALSQLRSLGIPAVYAHQTLAQLGDLRDALLVNAENRVIIRTQEPDASIYARHYAASGLAAADISSQEPAEHQYARFMVHGAVVPLCSIKPLGWPEAGQQRQAGAARLDWRTIVPAGPPARAAFDRRLAHMLHGPYRQSLAVELAHSQAGDWRTIAERWDAIAAAQRLAILSDPDLVPDQAQRQRWLSRLAWARPRLLVEAEQLRRRTCSEG
jgi:hypothetical protein